VSGDYLPVLEIRRGNVVESIHFGAIAVADSSGRLIASYGNPRTVTFLRSSAKPFQALPFLERGGDQFFHLTSKEIALMCASHEGTDEQVEVLKGIQAKVGVQESDLLCGSHPLTHLPTVEAMRARGETVTPNRHNCSGKHTGMLAHARMRGLPITDYVNPQHQIQQTILETLAEMCGLPLAEIEPGTDGCSAPNFALPLQNTARGIALLCDPRGLSPERAAACRRITQSMMANPDMVGGPGRFDTRLMETAQGHILAKGGAEGYQILGIMPGAMGADSPGVGVAIKISDGDSDSRTRTDPNSRARPAVALEVLRQLKVITEKELVALQELGPVKPVTNWRKLVVGESRPAFHLKRYK
jgi:L-asparaginase II